ARRFRASGDPQLARQAAGGSARRLPLHLSRPRRRPLPRRPNSSPLSRTVDGARTGRHRVRGAPSPLHRGAALGRTDHRWRWPRPHRARRRAPERRRAANRLRLPHSLPAQAGSDLRGSRAAARPGGARPRAALPHPDRGTATAPGRASGACLGMTQIVSDRGVLACTHIREAEVGARMLEAGGNAVDAVVAAAFMGFVVEPASCGLGGYGHMALFVAETRELVSVDHYVRAPAGANPDMFEVDSGPSTYYGWPPSVGQQNEWGPISVAVPGAVAGLCAAQGRWGRLPLQQVIEPAIEAAAAGVPVTWDLVLAIVARLKEIDGLPNAAAFLLR